MKSFVWLKNLRRRRYFFQACRWCCESNRLLLPFVESWQEENFPVLLLENISRVDGISAANSALPNLKNDSIFAFTDSTLTLEVLSTNASQCPINIEKSVQKHTVFFQILCLFSLPFYWRTLHFQMERERLAAFSICVTTPKCVISMSHFMPNCMPVPDWLLPQQKKTQESVRDTWLFQSNPGNGGRWRAPT